MGSVMGRHGGRIRGAGVALFKRRRHGVYLACGGRRARRGNDRTLFQPKPGEAVCCHEYNWRQQ